MIRRILASTLCALALAAPFAAPASAAPAGKPKPVPKVYAGWLNSDDMRLSRAVYEQAPDGSERALKYGPNLILGTPAFCATGNSVVAGHRTSAGGVFRRIDRLEAGDVVYAESAAGVACAYKVVSARIEYVGTSAAMAAVSADVFSQAPKHGSNKRLTLVSCTKPNGQPTSTKYRYIVELVAV